MELKVKCVSKAKELTRGKATVFAESEAVFELNGHSDNPTIEESDKKNIFKIQNWTGKETVKWNLLDENKEKILSTKECTTLEKFILTIPKKLSGNYSYYLRTEPIASYQFDGIYINGFCEPKILSTNIESDADGELCFGNIITVKSEAEGLNGNNIKVEIYNEKDICVANLDTKCHEGDIRREGFDTLGWQSKSKDLESKSNKEPKEYKFKVRIKNGNEYVTNSKNNLDVFEFKIKNKTVTPKAAVENNMIAKINDDKDKLTVEPQVTGVVVLESVLVDTDYTVTNDYVKNKKQDHWLWKDGNGKDCHWAKAEYREIIKKEDLKAEKNKVRKKIKKKIIGNNSKPTIIPVALPSIKPFKIDAWFKIIIPVDSVAIRLTDINMKKFRNIKDVKYEFDPKTKSGGKKDELFKLSFTSNVNPYYDQVQYFTNFQLFPEYSLDGETWTPMEIIFFELYIVWKEPINFSGKNIQETILRFACEHNIDNMKEEEIVDGAFASFNRREADGIPRVYRVREKLNHSNRPNGEQYLKKIFVDINYETGMGYWRGASTAKDKFKSIGGRKDEVLLEYGEARCGEWKNLFLNVLNVHGIDTCESIAICTDQAKEEAIIFMTYIYKTESKDSEIKSQKFAVKDYAYLMDYKNNVLMQNGLKSIGQGNSDAEPTFMDHVWCYYSKSSKFYDPSYAINCISSLNTYCKDNITSVYVKVKKKDDVKENNIQDYIWADKENLF